MEIVNTALDARERGRGPTRFNLAANDGAGDGNVGGGEGNPAGGSYEGFEEDMDNFIDNQEPGWEYGDGAGDGTDQIARSHQWGPGAGYGNVGILRYK